jgi:hypothetical protein
MTPDIFATQTHVMILTEKAMQNLEVELRRHKAVQSIVCPYCGAQVGNPCHTRAGFLLNYGHHLDRNKACPSTT